MTFDVRIGGSAPMSTTGCANVAVDAMVAVRAASSVIAPGGTVELAIARRPAVARAPLIVDAIASGRIVASRFVEAGGSSARLTLPPELAGFVAADAVGPV